MRQLRHPGVDEISLTGVLAALGDPVRMRIVRALSDRAEHPRRDFAFDLAQSTISHHMRTLREAGLTRVRTEGTRCFVSLRPEIDEMYPGVLTSILASDPEAVPAAD